MANPASDSFSTNLKNCRVQPMETTPVLGMREHGLSYQVILINFLNGMIGPGILSLSLVFRQAGLWTALLMVPLFGFLNAYCMLQLVHCAQHLSKLTNRSDPLDYGSVGYEACATNPILALRRYKHFARLFINSAVITLQVGICSVQFVFVAAHLKQITREQFNWALNSEEWMLLLLPPLILLNFVRTLKVLFYICSVGNVLMVGVLAFILQHLIFSSHLPLSQLPSITNFEGVASAFGSALYTFEGQAFVLPLENKLRNPKQMAAIPLGVLPTGMGITTTLFVVMGASGYLTYGPRVKGSVSLNLPHQPIFIAVDLILVLVVYFGYPLQQYVIVDMVWPEAERWLKKGGRVPERGHLALEMGFRALLVVAAALLAILVPNLEDIIPLVGITSGMLLAFVIPATLDTLIFVLPEMMTANATNGEGDVSGRWRKIYSRLAQNGLLVVLGLLGLVVGLQANIRDLIAG